MTRLKIFFFFKHEFWYMYPFPTDLVKIGSIAGRQTKINLKKKRMAQI